MKRLIYFTNSYPYGPGRIWKKHELEVLINHFDYIEIVPMQAEGNEHNPKDVDPSIKVNSPLFKTDSLKLNKLDLLRLFSRFSVMYLREFISKKVYLNKRKQINWLMSIKRTQQLFNHSTIKRVLNESDENTVFYFYWGYGVSEIVPFINTEKLNKVVVKMHGYDLFEYRTGYIAFRQFLLQKPNVLIGPTSQEGLNYLTKKYPKIQFRGEVLRCGTLNDLISSTKKGEIFTILTCSRVVPVKRLSLLVDALMHLTIDLKWIHLGDGDLFDDLKNRVNRLPKNIKVELKGFINSDEITKFYHQNSIDLFVNVSESEGAPFSIMEALSAEIPVLATAVGGTPEIVDSSVGLLVNKHIKPIDLADEIMKFYHIPSELKSSMRRAARIKYNEMCNAHNLTENLVELFYK